MITIALKKTSQIEFPFKSGFLTIVTFQILESTIGFLQHLFNGFVGSFSQSSKKLLSDLNNGFFEIPTLYRFNFNNEEIWTFQALLLRKSVFTIRSRGWRISKTFNPTVLTDTYIFVKTTHKCGLILFLLFQYSGSFNIELVK